jgi:hypothetical protein
VGYAMRDEKLGIGRVEGLCMPFVEIIAVAMAEGKNGGQ